jgi:hypothetical protein
MKLHERRFWNRNDLGALAILVLFFALLFSRALFFGDFLLANDPMMYSYPLRRLASEMLLQGTLPLWTPNVLSGYPLLSMAQLGLGYPITWMYLVLPDHWAEQVYVLLPYPLAPLFMYFYAREVRRSRQAALLAGLSFAYGGLMLSPLGLNGLLSNAVMWTPLVLIGIERARSRPFLRALLLPAAAYSMSVLTGIGQGFVYAGILAVLYAIYLCLIAKDTPLSERVRPVAVVLASILIAAGVSAFQILETMRAARLSVRAKLSYAHFSEGSFPFALAWRSIFDPIHFVGDVSTYLAPLTLLLALLGIATTLRKDLRDLRIYFWAGVAVTAFVLTLGANTPLYKLVHHIPVINSFRVPPRHSFEWTFALSMLAAYGWDGIQAALRNQARGRMEWLHRALAGLFLLGAAGAAVFWWKKMKVLPYAVPDLHREYLQWKIIFLVLLVIGLLFCWRIAHNAWRTGFAVFAISLACFIEPSIELNRWAGLFPERAERFAYVSPVSKLLRRFPPEQNRIYTQINLVAENHQPAPRIDPLNWQALAGLQDITGYEPLMMERYSRALNSPEWSTVHRGPTLRKDRSLFDPQSHVLDLLNVTYVASYWDLSEQPTVTPIVKEGIAFSSNADGVDLSKQPVAVLTATVTEADTLALVSALAFSTEVPDGTRVADITVYTTEGRAIERLLLAGEHTAEWAYEKPEVRAEIKHRLPVVFSFTPTNDQPSFHANRYLSRVALGERIRIARVEIKQSLPDVSVIFWQASLYDSKTRHSTPLIKADPERWEPIYNEDGAIILRNRRALPRAWLVTEAIPIDQVNAWKMIRGIGEQSFDPRKTALVEIDPGKLPALEKGPLGEGSYAKVTTYEANRIAIETRSDRAALLVVSELHYPGWVALLDGQKTPLHQANYLLRGVFVPAGTHRVEMSYKAPGARNGAIISLLTLLGFGWIGWRGRKAELA